jgi:nucleotide-binding universal stress UspA family protein
MTTHVVATTPRAAQAANDITRPCDAGCAFTSVLCAVDRSTNGRAARCQAALLASPEGVVERILESRLTRHGLPALHDSCEGHDLLVLGGGVEAYTAIQHTPIPILIARSCPLGTQVTDTILVPVDDSARSSHAVVVAGQLAAAHGGTVTVIPAPPLDLSQQRAIAASRRILVRATGAAPRVLGNQLRPERIIQTAAATITASLVVLGCGSSELERQTATQLVASLGCSTLVVFDDRCSRSNPCATPTTRDAR